MDFIKHLPIEITEIIIKYLNGSDILQCCQVSNDWYDILNKERTWNILCRQKGWMKETGELESWRDHYWLNHNWRTGTYGRHIAVAAEYGGLLVNLNDRFVITSHLFGFQLWRFAHIPSIHQSERYEKNVAEAQTTSKSFVVKLQDSIVLYLQDKLDKHYKLVKTISTSPTSKDYDPDLNLEAAFLETGCDRLVVVQKENKIHKILLWNLNDGHKYKSILLKDNIKHVFKIILFNNKIYLVALNKNEYLIKICDLIKEDRSTEIVAFKNAAFGVIPPELQVNVNYIVAFCPVDIGRDLCYSYSPLKVWNATGQLINSIILNSGRIDYFAFCLIDDLVIYRQTETVMKVWKPATDEELISFNVEPKICKIDKCIGSLIVLSYRDYFDVWDYKDGVNLYRVTYKDGWYSVINDQIVVNKYYYTKVNRNKNLVTVFSFMNQVSDENNCDNRFISEHDRLPFLSLKGI